MTEDKQESFDRRDRWICEQRSLNQDLSERDFAKNVAKFSQTTVRRALAREANGDFTPKVSP